jgi:hypothetical protein
MDCLGTKRDPRVRRAFHGLRERLLALPGTFTEGAHDSVQIPAQLAVERLSEIVALVETFAGELERVPEREGA